MMRPWNSESCNFLQEIEGRRTPPSRDSEGRIEHSLGDGEPHVLFGNRLEAKEDQRQTKELIRVSQSNMEGGLQRSVKTFNITCTMRMENSGSGRRNP